MEVMFPRCAGLDVHKDTVVACRRLVEGKEVLREVESFGTTTKELLRLSDWLSEGQVNEVVMESTEVYWRPVWQVLSGDFNCVLVNPLHVRNVPGRKSDLNDAQWLSELLVHGLIAGSFAPEESIQELRELTRTRKQLIREISRHTQRLQKVLEVANIKLTGLITDLLGVTGRLILRAAYFILRDLVPYRDLGSDHFDRLDKAKTVQRHVRKLHDLGFVVTLIPVT